METEKMYSTEDLIKHFRVSRYAITRAINAGKLKVERRGKRNFFTESAVQDFLEESAKDKYIL